MKAHISLLFSFWFIFFFLFPSSKGIATPPDITQTFPVKGSSGQDPVYLPVLAKKITSISRTPR
jgi:hypothetical protein